MTIKNAALSTGSLNLSTVSSGTTVAGTALHMGEHSFQKVFHLSATLTAEAETDTLTVTGKWQVSNDNSTWVDVANGTQNAAGVVFATGTAGDDAALTAVFPAPDAVYGWRWARFTIVTGGTTGDTVDLYTISYNYRTEA